MKKENKQNNNKPAHSPIIISGGSGAIGTALTKHFLSNNVPVLNLDKTQGEISLDVPGYTFFQIDASNENSVKETMKKIFAECHVKPKKFVNCSGKIYSEPVISIQAGKLAAHNFENLKLVVEANFYSSFLTSSYFAKELIANRENGVIVNLSSISHFGNRGQAAYSAMKAAVNSMTTSMAKELGDFGIRVVAVAPGFVQTSNISENLSENQIKYWQEQTALGRLGDINEVVHAIVFCLENGFFNGRVLHLDGGLYL